MSTIELGIIRKSPVEEFIADAIAADAKLDAALRVRNPRVAYYGGRLSQLIADEQVRTFGAGPHYLVPPKKKRKRR